MKRYSLSLLFLLSASSAAAQVNPDRIRVTLAPQMRVGGTATLSNDNDNVTIKLDADMGVGFGGRLELQLPILSFLSIAPFFSYGQDLVPEDSTPVFVGRIRMGFIEGGARVIGRIPLRAGATVIEPYLAVPIHYSFRYSPDENHPFDDSNTSHGFGTGAAVGVHFLFTSRFGAFVEGGWRHRRFFEDHSRVTLNQAEISLGFVSSL